MAKRKVTVEVFIGKHRQWYWHARAGNGEIIAASEGYTRKWSAVRGARRAFPAATVKA